MTFKEFITLSEEQSSTDLGLMGFPLASTVRKPSDGQPFKNLGSVAGAKPRGDTGGDGAGNAIGPMSMMRKMMKKNMKKV